MFNARFLMLLLLPCVSCQAYDFVFQPDSDRLGTHLRFNVETPSKADILFVIDNSISMTEEQAALAESIDVLLESLAPLDTSYRIGIVSTDAHGFLTDCNDTPLSLRPDEIMGAKGNCVDSNVVLQRPHDGTRGRLLAAYEPEAFNAANYPELSDTQQAILSGMLPTDSSGARWVIDRDQLMQEACVACECGLCDKGDACAAECADPIATALVKAYFKANVSGLGIAGFGWEEGLKSALWAVGIDPRDNNDTTALTPTLDLTATPGGFNTYAPTDALGVTTEQSWTRDDALLAVMFVSDEQDCSMPDYLMGLRMGYEDNVGEPTGSICYQELAQQAFLSSTRMGQLLLTKKGGSRARVAVGVIGGVRKTGTGKFVGRSAVAEDCYAPTPAAADPANNCTCLTGAAPTWCSYSVDKSGAGAGLASCDAFAGSRYLAFSGQFTRKTFESICRNDTGSFGPALADFARIATLACFDLNGVDPANQNADNIVVKRAPAGSADYVELPQTTADSDLQGWYYDAVDHKICLTNLERLVGDAYDIFVLTKNFLEY